MDRNSCAHFASIIRSKKDRILEVWRAEMRKVLGQELNRTILDDALPNFLDVISRALGGAEESREEEIAQAAEHGTQRAEQGFEIAEVAHEFQVLRKSIYQVCYEAGTPLTEEARDIVGALIDEAAAIAVGRFGQRREKTIKEEHARKITFAVHDFRTPLGAIALAAEEVAEALPPEAKTPDVVEPLNLLKRNIEQLLVEMEKTMREFANVFSGAGELRVVQIRLYDLATDVIDLFKMQAQAKQVTLSNEIDPNVHVAAAPDALHRILANLVGNALRYTRVGGVTISSSQKENEVEITVTDTGVGIVAERLASIFEPGTKESASPGMGFGLAIAKYLVELQGGRIGIESSVGKGTSVTITLQKPLSPVSG